jgi:hypothetical protein
LELVGTDGHVQDVIWFERIHVVPRQRDLGAVISEQRINVEVYNAFRRRAKVLDDITVEGPQGISVIDHLGVPAHLPATRSEMFEVEVSVEGDPQIDNTVVWEFLGVDTGGTTLWVLGFRLIPFPFDPGADEPVTETFGYLTNTISAFNSTEQRVQLREVPVGTISYAVVLLDQRDAQMANAILFGNQARAFGVARWPFRTVLTQAAAEDDTTIYCDTTDIPFASGGLVMLWTGPHTWEVQTIDTVAADHLTITAGVRNAWAATRTTVVPMVVGRLSDSEGLTWESLVYGSQAPVFSVDEFVVPTDTGSPTVYQGYDVLELNYDRVGRIEERLDRKFVLLDNKTGVRTSVEQAPSPTGLRPFTWTAFGRDEIAALLRFVTARKGMAVPFWLPTMQWDLRLTEDLAEDATIATVDYVRYVQQLWGTTGARRHIALWTLGNPSMDYYQVTDATDPFDYATESLSISPIAVRLYPAATTAISFLKLCRLENDRVTIEYKNDRIARATIQVRELPMEAPA